MFRRRPFPVITDELIQRKVRFASIYAFAGFSIFGILFAGLAGRNNTWNPLSQYFPQPKSSADSNPTEAPWRTKPLIYVSIKETLNYEAQKKRIKQERERIRRKLAYKVAEDKARTEAHITPPSLDPQIQSQAASVQNSPMPKP
jgi:hypothetical protein